MPSIQTVPNLAPIAVVSITDIDRPQSFSESERSQSVVRHRLEWLLGAGDKAEPVASENSKHRAIVTYCQKRGRAVTVRELQQTKQADLSGLNSEGIRSLLLELQTLGKGVVEGDSFTLA